MGRRVAALASGDARFSLAGALLRSSSPQEIGALAAAADVLVDFSAPEAAIRYAAAAAKARKAFVSGTTGLSAVQTEQLRAASRQVPVLLSPNFSPGVFALIRLAAQARKLLPGFDIGISETHHAAKKDAPSGTALRLSEAVGGAPIVSQRLGDAAGEHTLTLAGPCERLELTHHAHSRDVFARGALEAALWCAGRKPGLYGMEDIRR
jgi:4-hydroxy-tetrahydrodipicolinate reductase